MITRSEASDDPCWSRLAVCLHLLLNVSTGSKNNIIMDHINEKLMLKDNRGIRSFCPNGQKGGEKVEIEVLSGGGDTWVKKPAHDTLILITALVFVNT